jgi:hypothetical protein
VATWRRSLEGMSLRVLTKICILSSLVSDLIDVFDNIYEIVDGTGFFRREDVRVCVDDEEGRVDVGG